MPIYRDRRDAGEKLADAVERLKGLPRPLVLALPRGGVPVAAPVARRLDAPLDVLLVRKIGFPGREELAMGAVATGGVVLRDPVIAGAVSDADFREALEHALTELAERERRYRDGRPAPEVTGRSVFLVDDGLATGASMQAAIAAVRLQRPGRLVVAVPVAAQETCEDLAEDVDEIVCASTPEPFHAVGLWYGDFTQTSDEEVRALLGLDPGVHAGESP